MKRVKAGDRVWVRNPRELVERKVGTIMRTKRTSKGLRYFVEWDTDMIERTNGHHPGYRASEIVSIASRS